MTRSTRSAAPDQRPKRRRSFFKPVGGLALLGSSVLVLVAGSCARTDLDPAELEFTETPPLDADVPDVEEDADVDVPDVEEDACVPTGEEECNGLDDDCNGRIDDVPPIPCPDGGSRYCVAGELSECPRRCEVCVPGQKRACFVSFCYFWGWQTCQGDGRSWGSCLEERPPPACAGIAKRHHNSPQLEQCCIDQGYCCLDQHDLDNDGDRNDHLGACEDVVCTD